MDFVENHHQFSIKPLLSQYKNTELIILKAFTKIYAMAGLRLGYCLCANEGIVARLMNAGQPWAVSGPAQACGIAAIADKAYIENTRAYIAKERHYLLSALQQLNMTTYASRANYIFFKHSGADLKDLLLGEGILIRDCSNYRGLKKGFYRIAVKSHEDNERLVQALNKIIEKG